MQHPRVLLQLAEAFCIERYGSSSAQALSVPARSCLLRLTVSDCVRQMLSDDIRRAVSRVGCDVARFWHSRSQGGISTAPDARVGAAVLYLQSGHVQHLRLLLQTFEAFGL